MDHTIKIFQHSMSSQTHTWSESNPRVKDALKLAKDEIIDHILKETGMLIDSPTEKGGNTNGGPLFSSFVIDTLASSAYVVSETRPQMPVLMESISSFLLYHLKTNTFHIFDTYAVMLALNFALTPSENGVVTTKLNLVQLLQNTKNKMA